ncbi:MAG: DMT family transporter [Pseudomonadota bacterium]
MTNLRAIGLMIVAVAAFACSDALIKAATETISVGQVLLLTALGNLAWFLPRLKFAGAALFTRDAMSGAVLLRTGGEVFGSLGIVTGLALIPLTTVSAIMQAQPLVVVLVAALFLGETVGWRRWAAVMVGFVGVMVILRPATGGFDINMLWPLLGVMGLTARDVGTRLLPERISADFAITWAVIGMVFLGATLTVLQGGWRPMDGVTWALVGGTIVTVTVAYTTITAAFRMGEVAAIAPFRYTRMIFALLIGMTIFGERPDLATWAGIALIIGSGLYAFWREQQAARE